MSRGNVGTCFIPQATKWLNEQRWADHAAIAALQAIGGAPEIPIEDAVKSLARFGHSSRHAGPEPGLAGCRAPALVSSSPDWEKPKAEIAARRICVVALDLSSSWTMAAKATDEFTARMFKAINSMLLDMLAAIARKAEGKTEGALRILSAMPASPVC